MVDIDWLEKEIAARAHGRRADCVCMPKHRRRRIVIAELHQTMYHTLGIAPETHYQIEGRPFYTTPDGKAVAVTALLR